MPDIGLDWNRPAHLELQLGGNGSDEKLFGTQRKWFLVRPDGYIGYRGPIENLAARSEYERLVALEKVRTAEKEV